MKTKLNKVAKFGLNMPEPFANAVIFISSLPIFISFETNLGLVSVVRIALEDFAQLEESSD